MDYIIPVDFGAFKPDEFHSQWVGTEENGINGCFLVVTRVPPGKGTPGVHTHLGDQFYFIFKGEMNLQLADQVLKAKAGDLVYIPAAVPHKNFNTTNEDEIHWEFIIPGAFPGLARAFRTQWPEYELKEVVNPHYVRPLDTTKFDPNKTTHVTMADYSTGSHHCRIDIVHVPAGDGGGDVHINPFDEVYYTMTGAIDFQLGRQRHEIKANTYIFVPAGVPHTYRNTDGEVSTHIQVQIPEGPRAPSKLAVNLDL